MSFTTHTTAWMVPTAGRSYKYVAASYTIFTNTGKVVARRPLQVAVLKVI